jgi:hypothetical protein
LGVDHDITDAFDNVKVAEETVGHKWEHEFGSPESKSKYLNPAKAVMYNFAPDLDGNMVDSANSLKIAEKQRNKKYELLQLDSQPDPICSSAGCT